MKNYSLLNLSLKGLKMKNSERFVLACILLAAFFIRVWRLGEFPSVINGDETGSILHPLQILLGRAGSPFALIHDGSVSNLIFYPEAFFIHLLGREKSLLAVRLTTALISTAALIPFYFLLQPRVSLFSLVLAMSAFASSYWYLNFSRLSWIAVDSIFFGLAFLVFLEKMIIKSGWRDFIFGGILGALILYNYMGGRIYFLASLPFLIWWLFAEKRLKLSDKVKKVSLHLLIVVLLFSPQLRVIIENKDQYFLRARTLSIFNLSSPYYGYQSGEKLKIFIHQLDFIGKGFVLFDSSVSSEGIENQRLVPPGKSGVNHLIKLFFWLGLMISILKRKGNVAWWFIYGLNILVLQIPSVFVPSWSRAIGAIPIIYLFVGLAVEELDLFLRLKVGNWSRIFLVFVFLAASFWDINTYWQWVKSDRFKFAQQPAIELGELQDWQKAQVEWTKKGKVPFTIYQWHDPFWRAKNLSDGNLPKD